MMRATRTLTPTRAAGLVMLALGAVGVVVLLGAQGPSSAWLARSCTLAVVALLGWGAVSMPPAGPRRADAAVRLLLWLVAATVLANTVLAWVDLDAWTWQAPSYFPPMTPIGADFRAGAYAGAVSFSTAETGWPPFTLFLFQPYRLLGEDAAYVVHVILMTALGLAAIGLSVAAMRTPEVSGAPRGETDRRGDADWRGDVGRLGPVVALWLLTSFGFLLGVERGAVDALVAFLIMAGLVCLVRRPQDVWMPALLFAVAANVKVYPAILFVVLVWRFRRRSVLPIVVFTVLLALSAGPASLRRFATYAGSVASEGTAAWVGNSSAQSYAGWVDMLRPWYLPGVPPALLVGVPCVLFAVTVALLWRRRDAVAVVLMVCAAVPPMFLVPTISHDYKVVVLAGPLLALLALLLRAADLRSAESWWMLTALGAAMFFVARAPGDLAGYGLPDRAFVWPLILANKYLPILLVQCVVAWMAWRLPREWGRPRS